VKTILLATAAVAVLATAGNAANALADGPRASSNTAIVQTAADGAQAAPAGVPHYEWQYHYVGRHPRWDGYSALAK
jgi:hypothetical protein